MTSERLIDKAASYLHTLCVEMPTRQVGSAGNRAATDLFRQAVASFGWRTESPAFDCMDWRQGGAELTVEGASFGVWVSPYSLGAEVRAPLVVVSTVEELERAAIGGRVVLLRGEIAQEPLMPKNFPFYNPDHHQRIYRLLEAQSPQAIIAAPPRGSAIMGYPYPYPLLEDGDFDIPSVYTTAEEGERLAGRAGREARLTIRARRIPSTGCNIVAHKGANAERRVVLMAHIDSKMDTPGANDNASGVVVLLLLAELLAGYAGRFGIELVAMNGEDYYSNPGEQQYLALNAGRFEEIALGINLDGLAYRPGNTAYSLYECPADLAATIRAALAGHEGLVEGEPWYQGDHMLFLMNGRPTLAFTSDRLEELAGLIHTPQDTPEMVDTARLVRVALALSNLVQRL